MPLRMLVTVLHQCFEEIVMQLRAQAFTWTLAFTAALIAWLMLPVDSARAAGQDGIVRVESAYGVDETLQRLKADIEQKGIKFFTIFDQTELGAEAGIKLNPSKLLIFGNPPLGI